MLKPNTSPQKNRFTVHKTYQKNIINIPSLKKYLIDEIDYIKQSTDNRFRKTQIIFEQNHHKPLSGYNKMNGKYQSVDKTMQKFHHINSKKIEGMFKELKQIFSEIQNEQRRKSVLKQLTSIIQYELGKQEKQETLSETQLRQIRKIKSDTENYGKATNQLIGEAKNLKQQIYHDRKNRAMFSILFRDLQKQLKVQQNRYKKILIYSNQYGTQQNKMFLEAVQKEGTKNIVLRMNTNRKIEISAQKPLNCSKSGDCLFTEPKEQKSVGENLGAISVYCQNKNYVALLKPRREYLGQTKEIIRESTEETIENYTNFFNKVCAVASMNLRKMQDAMGPNGLQEKNNQLYKKISKLNQHIIKYQSKVKSLKKQIDFRQIYPNQEYQQLQQEQQNKQQEIANKFKNISQEQQKIIQQKKAQQALNQKIYSQMLYLTNTKRNQSIKHSPDQRSVPLSQQQVHYFLLSKIQSMLDAGGVRNKAHSSKSKSPKVQQNDSIQKPKLRPSVSLKIDTEQSQKQRNLNSILSNIKVYGEYERAFSRMEFQTEYYFQKNRKGKKLGSGLIRKR